ncbi:hypothetical protein Hanom_Chr03g00227691 [Helianthus anomalus]
MVRFKIVKTPKPVKGLVGFVVAFFSFAFGRSALKNSNRSEQFGLRFISKTGCIKPHRIVRFVYNIINL